MKNLITYLKTLWSWVADSQSTDVSLDCRLTVGSPSGFNSKLMLKLMSVLVLILTIGSGNVWGAETTFTVNVETGTTSMSKDDISVSTTSGTFSRTDNYRVYANNSMTISSSGGNITKVVFTVSQNTFTANVGTWTDGTKTWTGDASSITFSASGGQVRFTTFTVTYSATSPTLTVSGGATSLAMGDAKVNGSGVTNSTLSFSGANMTANATLAISGTNAGMFSVTPTNVSKGSGTITNQTITVTYSPTAAGNHTATLTISSTGATSKTIDLTGTGKYEVIWKNNEGDYETTLVASGSTPTFPDNPTSCDTGEGASTTFYGWATSTWSGKIDDLGGKTVYTSSASMPTVSANGTTYHAVFCKGSAATWDKVTSAPSDWSGEYVITRGANAMISDFYSGTSGEFKTASVTLNGTSTQITSTPTDKMIWIVEKNGATSQYSFKNKSTSTYAQITGTSSTNAALNASAVWFTISGSSGAWKINSVTNSARCFAYYADRTTFRTYANSTNYTGDLFKKTGGATSKYMTTCCSDPELAYATGSVTKTYGAGVFTNALTNSHSVGVTYDSSDPTVATVNGSGQVTILKAGSTTITASSAAQTVAAVSYCADEASYTLTVNKADISPTLTYDPAAVTVGSTLTSFTLSGNSGSGSVSYISSNDAIATVNSSGVVTGVAPGTVTITATIAATTNYNGNTATSNTITVNAAACTGVNSLHTGNKDQGGWVTNQCFVDADWGAADDAIYVGAFPLTNECYVGWAGGNSYHGTYWAVGGIKTYDIPTGRTLGWNSGNYYESYPGGALGTFHIYKNSTDENYYLRFKPSSYILRTGSDGTSWTSREMTVSATNSHYYETAELDLTSTLISEHAYVDLKTNGGDGHVWCNFSNDRTASGNVKVKSSVGDADGNFRGDNLKASDNGTHGKFRIDITKDVDNWKLAFVPMYRITYAAGTGASGSMDPSSYAEISTTIAAAANGYTAPTGKQFNGWSDGVNSYAAGANVTMNSNVTLTAQWTDIDYTVTVSQSPDVSATTTGQTSSAHYNGTINLTTTVPSGYRFVNWTTSDGFSITNPTSATTASFTMPAKNVTVTANFQQTHTVDWYVGGSAPANKIGDDGQTTVVDHGGKISDFPAHDPDGSACDKTFVGWTNTSSYVHGTSPLFNDVAGSPTINADANFYAVFAEVNSVSASLTKMTADDDLEVGDKIVIIAQDTRYGMYQASASSYVSYWTTTDMDGEPSLSEIEADDKKYLDVAAGSASNTWKLGDATNGYLYNASSTNLEFSTTNSSDLTLITWTDDSFTLQAGQYISCRTDITGANANKWRGAGASCDPENDNNCSGTPYYYLYKYVPGGTTATGHTINCADCGTSVTPTYTAAPTGGTVSVTKSATPVSSGSTVKTCTAVDLTVTITPASHYTLTGFTATGLSTGTATISPAVNTVVPTTSAQTFTVTVSAGATGTLNLTPTFTPETPLSITFIPTVSGATVGSIGTIYSGDNFDFPSVSNLPVGFCADFLGWVDFTNGETFDGDGTRTTAPSELITAGTNSGTMTANKIYKAVYGESETSEVEAYSKVTSSLADWSGNYLIVHEGSARALDGSLGTSNIDAQGNYFSVTISAGKITDDHSTKHWTIAKIGETSTYTIKGASGCYIGRATTGNGIDKTTEGASADANTISYSSGVTISGSGGPSLQYYNTSGQERFRYYGSAQQAISLFKLGTTEIITYTYTTAPSCGEKYRVTVDEVTGGSPSVSPKYCADGTTISLVANPSTGYTFTSWTITKDADDSNVTSTLLTGDKPTTANTTFEMPAYDITVTATYTIINYNITYNNLNGATNSNPATYNVASADIDFVDPGARAGYIFKGWYDDAIYTNQVTGIPNGSTGAVTVYAKWAVGYTITWDNAIGSNPASTGVEEGNAIGTLPVPSGSCTFDGTTYSNFVGWYTGTISGVGTAASDAGTEITSADVPTANATYHAVYTNMPDYSETNTSNVTLPEVATPKENVKVKVDDADDAPEYDGIKIGTSSTKTSSFTFTVPAGTTKITMQGVAWSGKTASVALSTSTGTISPSTAQSLANSTGASDRSPFTITSNTTLTFNLTNVNSTATITVANSNERVIVWGINASSASGSSVGYITQCCDNVMAAPTMNAPTVRTSTAITLSWNTVTNATGYKVSWNGGDWEDVATATTYEKTSLEPGTDYSYKVIAKYTSPYCGASAYEGVVSTKPVYSVTYERGHGTGSCSASGSIPAVAYYEEGAIVSLAASNTFSHPGNTFAAWSSEQVALTAESTTFTMPAENVTVTATWTAKQDKYYDRMHNLTSGEGSYTDGEGKHYIVREGCNYTVPSLTNSTTGDTDCHTTHYVLMGWAAAEHIQQTGENAGQVISGHESYVFTGGGTKTANTNTYYAVWAIVTE